MVGTIKAGVFPTPVPWTLKRVKPEEAWAIPERPKPPKPLANQDPSFEVATVKRSQPDSQMRGMRMEGRTFSITNLTLAFLVTFAYDLNAHQIVGAPAWFTTERFDITGKPEGEGQPTPDQTRIMLRKLLADRFQLLVHRDRQEVPVYTLNVAKSGLKLSKTEKKGETRGVLCASGKIRSLALRQHSKGKSHRLVVSYRGRILLCRAATRHRSSRLL